MPASRGKRKTRRVLIGLLVVVLALTGFILVQRARLPQLGPLVAMLDSAEVAGGWTRVSEATTPPLLICLGANPCPSAHRKWSAPPGYTAEEFQADVAKLGWELTPSTVCDRSPTIRGDSCYLRGVVEGVKVSLSYRASEPGTDKATVGINLSVRHQQGGQ